MVDAMAIGGPSVMVVLMGVIVLVGVVYLGWVLLGRGDK
jgi:hypothetical protein